MADARAQSVINAMQAVMDTAENMPHTDEACDRFYDWVEEYSDCFTDEEKDFVTDVFVACLKYIDKRFFKEGGEKNVS